MYILLHNTFLLMFFILIENARVLCICLHSTSPLVLSFSSIVPKLYIYLHIIFPIMFFILIYVHI